jgi:hypothetical protein
MAALETDDLRNVGAFMYSVRTTDKRADELIYAERRAAGIRVCGLVLATSGEDKEQMREVLDMLGLLVDLRDGR